MGHILHNVMYTGVLPSGETRSGVFEDLQIIPPANFRLAQLLMEQRAMV